MFYNILKRYVKTILRYTSTDQQYAFALPCKWVMLLILMFGRSASWADTPLTISSTYSTSKVYTVVSASGNQMYANDEGTALSREANTTPKTDTKYQFAFVQDPDNTSNYYLYNVGAKTFVTSSTSDTNAHLYFGASSGLTPVYVYELNSSNSHYINYATYNRSISFNSELTFASSNSNVTGSTNSTYHVLEITSGQVDISDWNFIGPAGNNSLKIDEVADVTFTQTQIEEAQRRLKTEGYKRTTIGQLSLDSTKVYRFSTNSGELLTVSSNTLAVTTYASDANTAFAIVPDATTENKYYLYNVATKKFLTGNSKAMGRRLTSTPVQVYLYSNDLGDDYKVSFSLSDSWSSGNNFNVSGTTLNINSTTGISDNNRFSFTEVTDASDYSLANAQKNVSTASLTLSEAGLSESTTYTLTSQRSQLYISSSQLNNTTTHSTDSTHLFAFVSNNGNYYLYSIGEEKFVKSDKTLTTQSGNADPIYIFDTGNDSYPLLFTFTENPTWGEDGNSTNQIVINTNTGTLNLNGWSTLDEGNQLVAASVGTFSEDEQNEAKSYLSTTSPYTATSFSNASLTTNSVVYTLQNESGSYLSASASGLTTSTTAGVNEQFVFFTPTSSSAKTRAGSDDAVYLYSVGQGQFVTSSKTLGTASQIYAFNTSDAHGYNLALGFSDTWTGNVVGTTSTDPDKANRFKATDVTTQATTYSQTAAQDAYNGVYTPATLSDLGLSADKVYYITSDAINTDNGHVIVAAYSNRNYLNWFSQSSSQGISDIADNRKPGTYFAFVTDGQDASKIYLYSVNVQKAVNDHGALVTGESSLQQVYLYATHNSEFPVAFSFSSTWNATEARNLDGSENNTTNYLTSTSTTLGSSKRFKLTEVTGTSYDLTTARAAIKGWLTGDFHYKGIHGRDFTSNGMQSVAEVHYYYYVKSDRQEYDRNNKHAIDLKLPLMRYLARAADGSIVNNGSYSYLTGDDHESQGSNMEPFGYFRWYDYNTDGMPANNKIQLWDDWSDHKGVNKLREIKDKNGNSLGYFGLQLNGNFGGLAGPCAANVGVYYTIPSEADNSDWTGDVIACDVSRYIDYNNESTANINSFTHEPTLSVRYIFHILPASRIADEMRDSLWHSNRSFADKGVFVFGARDVSSTMNLRTNLQSISQYYFHPITSSSLASKHIYHPTNGTSHNFEQSDFGSEIVQAKAVEWRVYNAPMTAYRVIATTSNVFKHDINVRLASGSDVNNNVYGLNGDGWVAIDGGTPTNTDISIGSTCYLVGYLTDGTDANKCPFFNVRLDIINTYPMSQTQIESGNNAERTETYLSTNYGSPVASFSFDNENSEQTLTAPTGQNAADNVSHQPSPFAWRQYSFVYYNLGAYSQLSSYNLSDKTYMPLHGDFDLYKMYGAISHDRTWAKTNGSQNGYFMFTDASDESRMLGYQDFQGSLCAGSQIIVSAWVANSAPSARSSQPELRFALYGVNKDGEGNDISTKLLGSICSGNFANNVNGYITDASATGDKAKYNGGTWYQVYGVLTLPAESNVSQFKNFRIAIDNFCNSTNGADYGIDDINVYQSNSRLTVIQVPALCEGNDVSKVNLKIRGNYAVIRDVAEAEGQEKTIYYRFCNSDGTAVTGTDFYGSGLNSYGTAQVPSTYDASKTIQFVTDGNSVNQFELDANGVQQLVLVDKAFSQLEAGKTYYVSVATSNPDVESSWGRSSDICSFYSSNFSLVSQNVVINGTQNSSTQITINCGESSSTSYDAIRLSLTAPGQVDGGTTILNTVKFDFFLGTRDALNDITDESGNTLLGAIRHYRDEYPNGTDGSETAKGTYTEAEHALLTANVYSSSNANGKVWLSNSTSLSGFPIPAGRQTILAIPTEDEIKVTVNGIEYTYELCNDPSVITVNAMYNGPGLVLGRSNVQYPSSETYRSVRLGLPQIKNMGTDGVLYIPVSKRTYGGTNDNVTGETLRFVESGSTTASANLYISDTNDPSIDRTNAKNKIAELANSDLASTDSIGIKNITSSLLHEGYWYEIGFYFIRTDGEYATQTNQCEGETYLYLKIVPEYLTWNPTADQGLNSNWNNDANWTRSTAGELYRADYTDYRTATYQFTLHDESGNAVGEQKSNTFVALGDTQPNSYVPMYFSKVTIPTLNNRPYPMLGYIRHQAGTNLVTSMTNGKSHTATTNIEYEMEAAPVTGSTANFYCAPFDGNLCEQIQFKTGAQMRNQQFLKYEKAWVELALPFNEWGTFTTPMEQTLAGDMYVPKLTGQQTTPAFQDITFDDVDAVDKDGKPWVEGTSDGTKYGLYGKAGDNMYNRVRMPVYQKIWGNGGNEYTESGSSYTSYDSPYEMLIYPSVSNGDNMDLRDKETYNSSRNVWSHTFNAVGNPAVNTDDTTDPKLRGIYITATGVAGKIGDDYATPTLNSGSWSGKTALMRLPKADKSFKFYKVNSEGKTDGSLTVDVSNLRNDNYKLGIPYSNVEGNIGEERLTTSSLFPEALTYELVGNPYTSSITVKDFVDANRDILTPVSRPLNEDGTPATNAQSVYRVWVLNNSTLYELNPENNSARIAPGQAFFIKVQNPGKDEVLFTTNMQTDPGISTSAAKAMTLSEAASKKYVLTRSSDVTNIIEHGVDDGLVCWSPSAGMLAVSGERIKRVEIYSISGQLVQRAEMSGIEKQFATGTGIYIVKATMSSGKTETKKLMVR